MWCVSNAWNPNDAVWYYSSQKDAENAIMVYIQNNLPKTNNLHIHIKHVGDGIIYNLTNMDTNDWFDIVLIKLSVNPNISTDWHKDFWEKERIDINDL